MSDLKEIGWVRLYRKAIHSSVWKNPNLWMIWCWCLFKASHRKTKFAFNGRDIELLPGDFITGRERAMAEIPFLTPQKWKSAINYLKATNRITTKTTNRFTIITVVNWDTYQCDDLGNNQQNNQQNNQPVTNQQPTNNQPITTYKNDKNDNNDNNKIKITQHFKKNVAPESHEFEKAWTLYPARNGKKLLKAEAKASFLKIKETDIPLVLIAIQNYASSQGAQDGFAKDMVRFLRNDRWREWLTMEIVQEITKKEPYPGGASIPWHSEQSPHPKPADPEFVKQSLALMKEKLYHQKQPAQEASQKNNKPTFIIPTENELLLAEKKKIDDRKKLTQLYGNPP